MPLSLFLSFCLCVKIQCVFKMFCTHTCAAAVERQQQINEIFAKINFRHLHAPSNINTCTSLISDNPDNRTQSRKISVETQKYGANRQSQRKFYYKFVFVTPSELTFRLRMYFFSDRRFVSTIRCLPQSTMFSYFNLQSLCLAHSLSLSFLLFSVFRSYFLILVSMGI